MTITPQGQLYLCKTPLENDYKNQLTFSNANAQLSYFNSVIQKTFDNYTYIKKDNVVQVGANIDEIIDCNYLFYKNTGFTNKYYFCFITNMEYVNENCTRITFETDCYQTWLFQIDYKESFVEREHVNDDTIGLHTVPENLETGEYIVNSSDYYDGLDNLKYVIQCTEWSTTSNDKPLATNFGGVYMAGGAYVCSSIQEVVNILQAFAGRGKSDAVYNLYMIPASMITNTSSSLQYSGQNSPNTDTKTITKVNTINGYTPINKKLLTFPFNYMLISNNNGSSNILHYERFSGNTCNFTIKGVPTVGGSIKIIPTNYDNNLNSEEEGLIAGKLPTLNWSDDEYTNWLTQNSVNIGLGIASSGLTIVGGLGMMATGGGAVAGAGAVVSGAMSIANELGAVYQHSLQPNSAKGNVNGGDINVCDHKNGFYFYKMSIKEEYARIIDNYFSMFGYKINRVKVPNITGRSNWNYVKTINCNFDGDIPQTDLNIIKTMFNNGVTLWHNPSTIYNYSNSNGIV
jgi:hypothetical protein